MQPKQQKNCGVLSFGRSASLCYVCSTHSRAAFTPITDHWALIGEAVSLHRERKKEPTAVGEKEENKVAIL